jgi:hypothetical protein
MNKLLLCVGARSFYGDGEGKKEEGIYIDETRP